jgi:hypothetical protein
MLVVRQKANEKLFFVLLVSLIAARQKWCEARTP